MTQYKGVNIIPKLEEKTSLTYVTDIHNIEWSADTVSYISD